MVGINTGPVKRLKGEGRPVRDEAARAAVLAGLADVDSSHRSANTPEALIASFVRLLVKGADYTIDKVGAVRLRLWRPRGAGAKLPGHSTTATVAKLASKAS